MKRHAAALALAIAGLAHTGSAAIPLTPGPTGAGTAQKVAVVDCRVVRGFLGTPVDGSTHSRDYRGSVRE